MLVLSRRPMECIRIGDEIVVTVLEVRGNKVRLGIDAPKKIRVLREELLHACQEVPTDRRGAILPSTRHDLER